MNPLWRSNLILSFIVASAGCALSYFGFRDAGALIGIAIFGSYPRSRTAQAAFILVALFVAAVSVALPNPPRDAESASFDHWFYLCGWLVVVTGITLRWRSAIRAHDA
jgi:hypothetical protein